MKWEHIGGEGNTAELAAAGHQLFARQASGRILEWGLSGTAWRALDENFRSTQIAWDGERLYQRHKAGTVFEYVGPPLTGWRVLGGVPATSDIIAESGSIFQRHDTGLIWEYLRSTNPPHWTNLGGMPETAEFAVARNEGFVPPGSAPQNHLLYERLRSGRIFKYTGTPQRWTEIGNHPDAAQIAVTGKSVYLRHGSGRISEYLGNPGQWREIGNNPQSAQIAAGGGRLHVRLETGRVFRYSGKPYDWQQLADNSPTAAIAVARGSGMLYKRHHEGSVWIFRDDPAVEPR